MPILGRTPPNPRHSPPDRPKLQLSFGRVTIEADGAEPVEFGPGDVMVMPSGWRGVWRVHEPVRKHFTTILDA
jgi:hypothetical protein